jgi:hypothetical protein
MPDPDDRGWMHPAELGRFDSLLHFSLPPLGKKLPLILSAFALCLGAAGVAALVSVRPPPVASASLLASRISLSALPTNALAAAMDTVQVVDVDAVTGRRASASAIVLANGREAITTAALSALGSMAASRHGRLVTVRYLGFDASLGLTLLAVSPAQTPTRIDPLPDNAVVTALTPSLGLHTGTFNVAPTLLGDPVTTVVTGKTTYFQTNANPALSGRTGTIAVDSTGAIVGILNRTNHWLSASYAVAASNLWQGTHTCRARLGVVIETASGGGALVVEAHHSRLLRNGDVIQSLNGHVVNDANDLLAQLYVTSGRQPLSVSVVREGTLITRHVTVGCGL